MLKKLDRTGGLGGWGGGSIPFYSIRLYKKLYSQNPHVRSYIFPSLAKHFLIFGGSYWQFRLKYVLD